MTATIKILWDTEPTLKRAQNASAVTGEKIAQGKKRKCSRGKGLISEETCRRLFTGGDPVCARDCGCSVGKLVAA